MKLTFKDLKQQKFALEADPSETIAQVKVKISEEKGWEPAQQKLIYSGKILADDNTVGSYNIEEKGFIVCMITKAKAASAGPSGRGTPSTPAAAVAQPPTPAAPVAPTAPISVSNVPATPTPSAPASSEAPRFNDPSMLAVGSERAAAIANMESMGFARADIDVAMRAAFFNPDRAVEYLLTGIPEELQQQQQERAAAAPAAAAPSGGGGTPAPAAAADAEPVNLFEAAAQAGQGGGRSGGRGATSAASAAATSAGTLDFLRNNPQFQQLRQIVQQQPQMLEPILQQVGAGNPQLAQMIASRPEEFLQLLAEDHDDDVTLPPGAQAISVTDEEREAIERLCRLGFERDLVIQAYFACDKNEELAANFLFDTPDDDVEHE
ncbi:UV excision repair protein Rad23 [Trichodelitschia bisporula]|uniref:UV excision repair protein RAD23 n=1 Tax=Trichodelitschia bisporula TaxID=703511 RepID=A0A6G1HMM8_9PEZI|nr:UV excision repair protein Rad23 [Trichodelitschia bisporula]